MAFRSGYTSSRTVDISYEPRIVENAYLRLPTINIGPLGSRCKSHERVSLLYRIVWKVGCPFFDFSMLLLFRLFAPPFEMYCPAFFFARAPIPHKKKEVEDGDSNYCPSTRTLLIRYSFER
jgi:hypothetical protein